MIVAQLAVTLNIEHIHRGPKNVRLFRSTVVSINNDRFLQYLAHSILKKFPT